jgi:hypothetical protein
VSKPHTCPVCRGSGRVPSTLYNPTPPGVVPGTLTGGEPQEVCRTCRGGGVVWPPDENVYPVALDGHLRQIVDVGLGSAFPTPQVSVGEPITPAVEHDALQVEQDITKDAYTFHLLNPDGSEAAPPLVFHRGSPEEGWHGWTTAKVLAALIAHMEYHQSTDFACDENLVVLRCLQAAHRATKIRSRDRRDRGVLYNWRKP